MEIKIPKKTQETIKLTYGEDVYEVKKPLVGVLRKFEAGLKQGGSEMSMMVDFLVHLGLPQDVVDGFDLDQMKEVFKSLSSMYEKKS